MRRRDFLLGLGLAPLLFRRTALTQTVGNIVAAVDASPWWQAQANYHCDGVNDGLEILQAASCHSVILSDGTFHLSSPLELPANINIGGVRNLSIITGSDIWLNDGQTYQDIIFDGTQLYSNQWGLGNNLHVNHTLHRNLSKSAIYVRGGNNPLVEDATFVNITGSGGEAAIHLRDLTGGTIRNIKYSLGSDVSSACAFMLNYCTNCLIESSNGIGGFFGVQVRSGSGHKIQGNWFSNPYGSGVEMSLGAQAILVCHNKITNPVAERGITVYNYPNGFCSDCIITENEIYGCPLEGIYVYGQRNQISFNSLDCPIVEGTGADYNIFAGNVLSGVRGTLTKTGANSRII